jgi:hypothetical protein
LQSLAYYRYQHHRISLAACRLSAASAVYDVAASVAAFIKVTARQQFVGTPQTIADEISACVH